VANPQKENGHIDIANEIADKLCSYRLSGQEWQIIWVVLRKTWGWLTDPNDKNSPKKKTDYIALSQMELMTGIDRRKCHYILKKLINKGVLIKTVTQKGDKGIIRYGFQKDYDKWKVSPKKVTVTQKGDGVSPKKVTKLSPKKAHTKEKKETNTKDRFDYPDWLDLQLWKEYKKMRIRIKKPLTDYAEKLALKKLTNMNYSDKDKLRVIKQTIFHSWQGFFPLKDTETPEPPQESLEELCS